MNLMNRMNLATNLGSQAFVPRLILLKPASAAMLLKEVLSILAGVLLISLLAQVALPLPFTPVPITGQTFGVSLVALLWGRRRGLGVMIGYLALGAAGMPVFAMGAASLAFGPTLGYLLGMWFSVQLVGYLADRGWPKTFRRAWAACFAGSLLVFGFGALVLSFFMPTSQVLVAGVLPFIPGDLIKTTLAASVAVFLNQRVR
ncbi:biotin transporter BioY [Bdellovibrionota bacterium FG-2]